MDRGSQRALPPSPGTSPGTFGAGSINEAPASTDWAISGREPDDGLRQTNVSNPPHSGHSGRHSRVSPPHFVQTYVGSGGAPIARSSQSRAAGALPAALSSSRAISRQSRRGCPRDDDPAGGDAASASPR